MSLPTSIFRTEIKCSRVLQVGWQDHRLVSGLAWKLDTEVPRIQRDERELEIVLDDMFLDELINSIDCIAEGAGVSNVLPGQCSQAGWMIRLVSSVQGGRRF